MENILENKVTPSVDEDIWQLRPEAAQAMEFIEGAVAEMLPEGEYTASATSIEFPVLFGQCTISVKPLDVLTYDGLLLTERFEARTLLTGVLDDFSDEFYCLTNQYATTGATLRCPATGDMIIASGISVGEQDTRALHNLYAPSLVYSSVVQSFSIQVAMHKTLGTDLLGNRSDEIGLPGKTDPSSWQARDFAHADSLMRQAGIFCNAGPKGLTAEFAWDPGAVASIAGGRTSLMRFFNNVTHPTAGNGLQFVMYLPITGDANYLSALAIQLNDLEIHAPDVPPLFGAWTTGRDGKYVCFQGFWPNCMYQPGTVANIAMWCQGRSGFAKQLVEELKTRHDC
jgi:hypothetical protein